MFEFIQNMFGYDHVQLTFGVLVLHCWLAGFVWAVQKFFTSRNNVVSLSASDLPGVSTKVIDNENNNNKSSRSATTSLERKELTSLPMELDITSYVNLGAASSRGCSSSLIKFLERTKDVVSILTDLQHFIEEELVDRYESKTMTFLKGGGGRENQTDEVDGVTTAVSTELTGYADGPSPLWKKVVYFKTKHNSACYDMCEKQQSEGSETGVAWSTCSSHGCSVETCIVVEHPTSSFHPATILTSCRREVTDSSYYVTAGSPVRDEKKPGHVVAGFERSTFVDASEDGYNITIGAGAVLEGCTLDIREGSIWIGHHTVLEPGSTVKGPAIVGANCVLRPLTFIRGSVIVEDGGTYGGELKNCLCFDRCDVPHHSYVGDSCLGYKAHLGCGAVTANFPLFESSTPSIRLALNGSSGNGLCKIKLGRQKIGAVLGDYSQLGCNSVTDPATFFLPQTHTYPLTRISAGVYGPHEILKNKPIEAGVVIRHKVNPESTTLRQ